MNTRPPEFANPTPSRRAVPSKRDLADSNNPTISGARTTNSVTLSSTGTINISGTFSPTASFTSGGYVVTGSTVNFNGANGQTIPAFNYNNLSSSNNARTLASSGTIGIAWTFTPNGGAYTVTGSTVDFNGGVAETIPTVSGGYNNLSVTGTGTAAIAGAALTVAGDMTIGPNAWLAASTFSHVLGGANDAFASAGRVSSRRITGWAGSIEEVCVSVESIRRITTGAVAVAAAAIAAVPALAASPSHGGVRTWTIRYRAHDGADRPAFVVLPAWYGPKNHPPLPLIISPHGRGVSAAANARLWGDLPAEGQFAVVNPGGQGRKLALYSWGYRGQIDDLARMPTILHETLPWLSVDRRRIYAIGGSMGGQEALLLLAQHPHLLAGVAAFDAPTNMTLRYKDFPDLKYGASIQKLAVLEVGGTPIGDPRAYAARSPLDFAGAIARSGVPLQLWWSVADGIVRDQRANSGALYDRILAIDSSAPVTEVVGCWMHSAEMTARSKLPIALIRFGLLPSGSVTTPVASTQPARSLLPAAPVSSETAHPAS